MFGDAITEAGDLASHGKSLICYYIVSPYFLSCVIHFSLIYPYCIMSTRSHHESTAKEKEEEFLSV